MPNNGTAKDTPFYAPLFAGAFAGLGYWAPVYGVDFIKTRIQSDSISNPKYTGMNF